MYFSRVRFKRGLRQSPSLHSLIQGNGYGAHQLLWELFPGVKQRPFIFREEIAEEQAGLLFDIKGAPIYYLVSNKEPLKESTLLITESKVYSPRLKAGDCLSFKIRANPVVARKEPEKKNSVKHDIVMDAQKNLLKELCKEMGIECNDRKAMVKQDILAAWESFDDERITARLVSTINQNERFAGFHVKGDNRKRLLYWAMKAFSDKELEKWLAEKGLKNGFEFLRNPKSGLLQYQAESYRWHALFKKGRNAGFSSVDFEGRLKVFDPGAFIDALCKGIGPSRGFGCGLLMVRKMKGPNQ